MAGDGLQLIRPDTKYEESFRAGFGEISNASEQLAWIYLGEAEHDRYSRMPFSEYVKTLLSREHSPPDGFVCDTVYWGLMGGEVVGRIAIRHELNDFLRTAGGHIGYITRPSYRGKGIATEMLRQLLATDRAKAIGNLLLTCDETNTASEKTIINLGGVLQNIVEFGEGKPRKKRFWIRLNHNK